MGGKHYDNGWRFNRPTKPETPGQVKFRLFEWCPATGGMEHFYDQYPLSRPKKQRLARKFKAKAPSHERGR